MMATAIIKSDLGGFRYTAQLDISAPDVEGISILATDLAIGQQVNVVQVGDTDPEYGFIVTGQGVQGCLNVPEGVRPQLIDQNRANFALAYFATLNNKIVRLYEVAEVMAIVGNGLSVSFRTGNLTGQTATLDCVGVSASDFVAGEVALVNVRDYASRVVVGWWELGDAIFRAFIFYDLKGRVLPDFPYAAGIDGRIEYPDTGDGSDFGGSNLFIDGYEVAISRIETPYNVIFKAGNLYQPLPRYVEREKDIASRYSFFSGRFLSTRHYFERWTGDISTINPDLSFFMTQGIPDRTFTAEFSEPDSYVHFRRDTTPSLVTGWFDDTLPSPDWIEGVVNWDSVPLTQVDLKIDGHSILREASESVLTARTGTTIEFELAEGWEGYIDLFGGSGYTRYMNIFTGSLASGVQALASFRPEIILIGDGKTIVFSGFGADVDGSYIFDGASLLWWRGAVGDSEAFSWTARSVALYSGFVLVDTLTTAANYPHYLPPVGEPNRARVFRRGWSRPDGLVSEV